jgi:IgA Peptidase M64
MIERSPASHGRSRRRNSRAVRGTPHIASTDSGADVPCVPPAISVRTFLDATFCLTGLERLIGIATDRAVALARTFVADPKVLVVVNTTKYGGSGGNAAVTSMHPDAVRIAIHEMGHSFFNVADEYLENQVGAPANDYWAKKNNVTTATTPAGVPMVKWPEFVAATTPIPTAKNTSCVATFDANPVAAGTVGAFEGAARFNCGAWRAQHRCTMSKDFRQPFCRVCGREISNHLSPFAHRPIEIRRDSWTLGWTIMNPFMLGGQPHFITYKTASGGVSIDRMRPDASGLDQTMGSTWSTGWTSLVPMATTAGQFLVMYKALTGRAEVDAISADGQDVTTVSTDTWTTGWTHLVAFDLPAGPHLLSYKVASGSVAIDLLAADGSGFTNTMGSTWSGGWTTLLPVAVGGRMLLLTYKVATGEMQISEISSDGQDVTMLSSHGWSLGWTGVTPFVVDGDVFVVLYSAATGLMQVERIRPDGSGTDTVVSRPWAPGWSLFAPFTLGGIAHELVYRMVDGAAAIDRMQ